MHIPDAYLSPATEGIAFLVMLPIWVIAAKRTARDLTTRQVPLLSIGAAFCFAIQMFNLPALGGTTAHALGAALLAILVGPWAAVLGMTLTLGIQALLFGDGGILSLGANCFSMAFVACFVGHGVFRLVAGGLTQNRTRVLIGSAAGAYLGTVCAALSTGLVLGLQPLIAHDAFGRALYFPFGWNVSVPAMAMSHLLIAGPVEAILTVAAVNYLRQAFPELISSRRLIAVGTSVRLAMRLWPLLVLTPLGLIASGSAWGEWDLGQIKQMVGYEPAALGHATTLVAPALPDYALAGRVGTSWEVLGYLLSAVVGCVVVALFTRALVRQPVIEPKVTPTPSRAGTELPIWMRQANPPVFVTHDARGSWFDATLLRMKSIIQRSVETDLQANQAGFLQRIHPTVKSIGFVAALIATGLSQSVGMIAALIVAGLGLAVASRIPLKPLVSKVLSCAMFFGLAFAIPVCLQSVTPGPSAFEVFGIVISKTGLASAALLLLRLMAGIFLATLWHRTTRWHALLGSLRQLGLPKIAVATASLTYRYLFVVFEVLAEMVEARKSRQVGACDAKQAQTYAGTGSAVLFAKSLALTEETHLAMISRGFDGGNRPTRKVQNAPIEPHIPLVTTHAI